MSERGDFTPRCMTPRELVAWHYFDRLTNRADAAIPCHDCLAPFAAEMRVAGRCNGNPGMPPTFPKLVVDKPPG